MSIIHHLYNICCRDCCNFKRHHPSSEPVKCLSFLGFFIDKLILEVFGAAGAVWGSSDGKLPALLSSYYACLGCNKYKAHDCLFQYFDSETTYQYQTTRTQPMIYSGLRLYSYSQYLQYDSIGQPNIICSTITSICQSKRNTDDLIDWHVYRFMLRGLYCKFLEDAVLFGDVLRQLH